VPAKLASRTWRGRPIVGTLQGLSRRGARLVLGCDVRRSAQRRGVIGHWACGQSTRSGPAFVVPALPWRKDAAQLFGPPSGGPRRPSGLRCRPRPTTPRSWVRRGRWWRVDPNPKEGIDPANNPSNLGARLAKVGTIALPCQIGRRASCSRTSLPVRSFSFSAPRFSFRSRSPFTDWSRRNASPLNFPQGAFGQRLPEHRA
jgi:hypothetical protein